MMETKTPPPTTDSDDSCHDTTDVHEVHVVSPKEKNSKPNHRQWILKALEARYQNSVEGHSSSPTSSPQCVKDLVQPNLEAKEAKEKLMQIENLLFKLAKKDDEFLDEAKLALGLKDLTARLVRRRLRRHALVQTPVQQEDVGFRGRIPLLPPLILSGIPVNRKFTKFAHVKQGTTEGDDK